MKKPLNNNKENRHMPLLNWIQAIAQPKTEKMSLASPGDYRITIPYDEFE